MKRRHILWIGLLLYVVSFFLVAVGYSGVPSGVVRGYACAEISLISPLTEASSFNKPFEYVSLLISGWINLVFVTGLCFTFSKLYRQVPAIFGIVIVLMIPFPWVVFHHEALYPREGHFVWIAGMLLVLFSERLEKAALHLKMLRPRACEGAGG